MKKNCLALLLWSVVPILQAGEIDQYGLPRVSEQLVDFTHDSDISREIAIGKILEHTHGTTHSYVRLVWSDDAFSYPAQEIRRELIRKAILPDRIEMAFVKGGYSHKHDLPGIRVYVQRITQRLPECHYAMQSYRYQPYENHGCAVTHNRAVSFVTPYKVYF